MRTGREFVRIIRALLTAALAPAVVGELLDIGAGQAFSFFAMAAFFILALAHAVVFGLPAYFVLRKLRWLSWWVSIICGFMIGTVLPLMLSLDGPTLLSDFIYRFCIGGLFGTVGGFSAWLVWRFLPPPQKI